MVVLVVLLGVVAVAAVVTAMVLGRRLGQQRALAAAADERSANQAEELTGANRALEASRQEHAAAVEQIAVADARADMAEGERDQARSDTEVAVAARIAAEERAAAAEQRTDDLAARHADTRGTSVDADVLWALERARSTRQWRLAVAIAPDAPRPVTDTPLLDALRIELDAAREEVGATVDLDVELPDEPTAASSLLTLRATQELLAGVVRRAEETTIRVRPEEQDIVVTIRSVDADGDPIDLEPLTLPPSLELEPIPDGVRVRNAIGG
ncbi:MAG: hypothetical protein ACRDZ2_12955 [Ilumatobacteraceae bacterium]